jgi:tyrosine-protein kinase Etk/Wzc
MIVKRGSRSAVTEMFRLLRTNLNFLSGGENDKVTLITSSISGEGKTFITINLGLTEALAGKKTVLLGFDLRKPKLSRYIQGEPASKGLTSYLVNETSLDEIIQPIPGNPKCRSLVQAPFLPTQLNLS